MADGLLEQAEEDKLISIIGHAEIYQELKD